MTMTPAQYAIYAFKGVRALARAINRPPSQISHWKKAKDLGGGGGSVPNSAQRKILEVAKEKSIDITAHDLIFGREVMEEVA